MTQKTEKPMAFIQQFEDFEKSLSGQPDWLTACRQEGLARYRSIGLPTVKDEEWKYTNVSPLVKTPYPVTTSSRFAHKQALSEYMNADDYNIVFINGVFSKELSSAGLPPKGIETLSLKEMIEKAPEKLQAYLKNYRTDKENAFQSLNRAFLRDGLWLEVAEKRVVEQVIHIVHLTDTESPISYFPRTWIHVGTSAEATILESHISFSDDQNYFVDALTDIFLDENATLHYVKAQKESLTSFHIGNTRVWQQRNSNFDGFSYMNGAAITRNDLDIILDGEGIDSTLNGLYCPNGTQHIDNHTMVDHRFPNCTSNQLYKGILNGSGRAVFNGKIFVRDVAQQTNSYQLNKNLLLGTDCRVDTKPQLEIDADDVKCTHGATIGQLDEDQIFYLRSRCISRRDAVKILAQGFIDDTLSSIKSESILQKIHILLQPTLAAL